MRLLKKLAAAQGITLGEVVEAGVRSFQARAGAGASTPEAGAVEGWAEAHGFVPGTATVEKDADFTVSTTEGWPVPFPGLAQCQNWPEEDVLEALIHPVADAHHLLGTRVLPKLARAYDAAEFADLLWTAVAYTESGGGIVFNSGSAPTWLAAYHARSWASSGSGWFGSFRRC